MRNFNPHHLWPTYSNEKYEENYKDPSNRFDKGDTVLKYNLINSKVLEIRISELKWDTTHFGFNCFKLSFSNIDNDITLTEELIVNIKNDIQDFIKHHKVKFVFSDINSMSINSNKLIQAIGFKFIVSWLDGFVKTKDISFESKNFEKHEISKVEIQKFSEIAKENYYKGGRFHLDKNFESQKVNELYQSLVINSFQQNDIIVSEKEDQDILGIFVCKNIKTFHHYNDLKVAQLRFLLLDPNFRGRSIGEKLFQKMLSHLKNDCDIITTGIESHNLISLNLHMKMGFKFNYSHNAYHLWI